MIDLQEKKNPLEDIPQINPERINPLEEVGIPTTPEGGDTNVAKALLGGFVRGATEPFTLIKPVHEISERMKQYRGNTLAPKITYGLGYVAGFLLPTTLEFKIADRLVRGMGLVQKIEAADKIADLTRIGKFTRGAVTGALYGAGTHADDLQESFQNIALNATIGGVADIVLPAAWAALSARWGGNVNPEITNLLEETLRDQVHPVAATATVRATTERGIALHAQAMQLLDDFDSIAFTPEQQRYYQGLRDRGINAPPSNLQPSAERRLALQLGLESLNLPELQLGEYRIIPTPHQDAGELAKILKRTEDIDFRTVKDKVIVGRKEGFDPAIADEINKYGFVRGQEVIHKGSKWIALRPSKTGESIMLTQPGRHKRPISAKINEVQFLPIVQDITKSASVAKIAPLSAEFMQKYTIWAGEKTPDVGIRLLQHPGIKAAAVEYRGKVWQAKPGETHWEIVEQLEKRYPDIDFQDPSYLDDASIGFIDRTGKFLSREEASKLAGISIEEGEHASTGLHSTMITGRQGEQYGFMDAFQQFTKEKGLNAGERFALLDRFVKLQRQALAMEDPLLGRTLETMDQEVARLASHPDGLLDQVTSEKALTYLQEFDEDTGKWFYLVKDHTGRPLSPKLYGEEQAIHWTRNYGVEPGDVIEMASPLASNVVPSLGVSSVKPHTTGELSEVRWHPSINLFADLMPRATFFKFAEDKLIRSGIEDIKPYTEIFLPLSQKKSAYQREMATWLKGGKLEDGTQIKGLLNVFNPNKPVIRDVKKAAVVDLMEAPRSQWSSIAREFDLNEKEVEVARELRGFFNQIFDRFVKDENINITADDFIENYFPHYRKLSDTDAKESVIRVFKQRGTQVNKHAMKFLSEYQRRGTMTKYDKDPFTITMKYLRTGLSKAHIGEPSKDIIEKLQNIPELNDDLIQLKTSLANYVRLTLYGAPEAFNAVNVAFRNVVRKLNVPVSEIEEERIINTYLSLNYGAYLGFRPGLVIRNLSQMLVTGYPILGAKYLGYGMKMIASARGEALDEARRAGAIITTHSPVPGEDFIYSDIQAMSLASRGLVSKADKIRKGLLKFSEFGMRGFTRADDINRTVIYFGQKRKAIDAWNQFGAEGNEVAFKKHAGLNYFGPAVTQEFERVRVSQGIEEAAKWIGSIAAGDSQWVYQLGAGPSLFSHGVGRLAGQYGTWPMWYAAYMAQGARNLKGIERALFVARNAAVNSAMIGGGAAVGLNLTRWTGLSSLSWMGGPAVDWFTDARDIVTGLAPGGEVSGKRHIAFSRYGLRDDGTGFSLMPDVMGENFGRVEVKDPARLGMQLFGQVTPGFLMLKDIYNTTQSGSAVEAALKMMALPQETVGHEMPQVRVR